jgi:hypothetical protein
VELAEAPAEGIGHRRAQRIAAGVADAELASAELGASGTMYAGPAPWRQAMIFEQACRR